MHGRLLMPDQDVADAVLLEDGVIDRQHGAAGIAEDNLDALVAQGAEQHFGAGLLDVCSHVGFPSAGGFAALLRCVNPPD